MGEEGVEDSDRQGVQIVVKAAMTWLLRLKCLFLYYRRCVRLLMLIIGVKLVHRFLLGNGNSVSKLI